MGHLNGRWMPRELLQIFCMYWMQIEMDGLCLVHIRCRQAPGHMLLQVQTEQNNIRIIILDEKIGKPINYDKIEEAILLAFTLTSKKATLNTSFVTQCDPCYCS